MVSPIHQQRVLSNSAANGATRSSASTARRINNGAVTVQWDDTGTLDQQWRLIPATVTNYDFVAPAAPTLVTASANAVSVHLNWKTNSESDLASYTVLRATNSGGPYEICARGLTNNSFTDKSANQPKTFYYVVKAVDRSLNSSVEFCASQRHTQRRPGAGGAIFF